MNRLMLKFATKYQKETGCNGETATQAAHVMATLFADLVGDEEAGKYFLERAERLEAQPTQTPKGQVGNAGYFDKNNHGWY